MKVPRSVSIDESVLSRIEQQAKLSRDSVSRWIEDACIDRLDSIVQEGHHEPKVSAFPKTHSPVSYRKPKRKKSSG
jgi:hypothetical protein